MKKEDFAEQERQFIEDVSCSIKARHGVIQVVTEEEERAKELIKMVCEKTDRALYIWKSTKGLYRDDKPVSQSPDLLVSFQQIYSIKERAVFLFLDVHHHLEKFNTITPLVIRHLKDMAQYLPATYSSLILISPTFSLSPELEKLVKMIELPLPDMEVFQKKLLSELEQRNYIEGNKEEKEQLLLAAMGLTFKQAEDAFFEVVSTKGKVSTGDIGAIFQKKKEIIHGSGLLEFVDLSKEDMEIGGQEVLKDWLKKIRKCFSEEAKKIGIKTPKGVLLLGISGCGKSWMVKVTAKEWNMLLIRVDPGRLYNKYVGESEENIRKMIQIVQVCAPSILWIDEIEKGFPRKSQETNGGTSERLLGTLLSWMAEKESPVFIMGTCNNLNHLSPELTRKGRFDEVFFIDLPSAREREDILKIHLKKRGYNPVDFNIHQLVEESKGFTGAEIESAIDEALRDAFSDGIKLNTQYILDSLKQFAPLSKQRGEEVMALRTWANGRARNASKTDIESQDNQSRWDTLEGENEKKD